MVTPGQFSSILTFLPISAHLHFINLTVYCHTRFSSTKDTKMCVHRAVHLNDTVTKMLFFPPLFYFPDLWLSWHAGFLSVFAVMLKLWIKSFNFRANSNFAVCDYRSRGNGPFKVRSALWPCRSSRGRTGFGPKAVYFSDTNREIRRM